MLNKNSLVLKYLDGVWLIFTLFICGQKLYFVLFDEVTQNKFYRPVVKYLFKVSKITLEQRVIEQVFSRRTLFFWLCTSSGKLFSSLTSDVI